MWLKNRRSNKMNKMNKKSDMDVFGDLMAITEASKMYGTSVSTIKRKIREGVIVDGVDCKNYGKQWVITRDAMSRVFGVPVSNLSIDEQVALLGRH